jgi:ATP-dependent helicase/nuclease subunit A
MTTSTTSTASPAPPADHEARARAMTELALSVALSAGAGSGKTSVLTERIVKLLVSGTVEPRQLAAMTFTEKAAGEILARVRDALEQRFKETSDLEEQGRLAHVLERFGELTLTTIHSFCKQILSHESLEADFAPDTEVGDEGATRELLKSAVQAWLARLRRERPELWRLVERLVKPGALVRAARELDRYRDLRDVVAEQRFDFPPARAELEELRAEVAAAAAACKDENDKLLTKQNHVEMLKVVDAALGARTDEALIDVLLWPLKVTRNLGAAKNWRDGGKQTYLAALEAICAWQARWRERAHGEIVRSLRADFLPAFDDARRRAGLATFDDLLLHAARLLRTSSGARARLAARWRVLLVDEVQDTDPVQAEVVALLSRALVDTAHWTESAPEAGRLFVVGDPKQSIYGFRGADVGTFGRIQAVVEKNGHKATLTQNFRSVPGIVSWVNHTFRTLEGYTRQEAHRAPAALDPVVVLQSSDAVDEIDAAVRHLRALIDGGAQVVDREKRHLRHMHAGDVMFLLPSWGRADAIADRLRACGLDAVVEGGNTFFRRDEVRLGMAALRAFVEPADTEATVFLLRGLFGLSHEELARHAAAKGTFRFTLPSQPPGRVADALAILLRLHRRRGAKRLTGLLDELLHETRAPAVWKLLPDGDSRIANVDKLASMIREAEARTRSPLGAVEEMLRIEGTVANKDIDRLDDEDTRSVRVTSLFKAKGLEAPVVIVLHATRKRDGSNHVVDHDAGRVAVQAGELVPPLWKDLKAMAEARENEERRRWMYVAATRARDQLVVVVPPRRAAEEGGDDEGEAESARAKPRAQDLLGADIQRHGLPPGRAEHEALVDVGEDPDAAEVRVLHAERLPEAATHSETFPGHDAAVDALLESAPSTGDPAGDALAARRRQALKASTRACLRWRQASGEPGQMSGAGGWKPGTAIEQDPTEDRVGARGGRVIHAVMERLDLSQPHDVLAPQADELVKLLATQAALPEEKLEACRRIVARILKNPLLELARKAAVRWHEVPFTYAPRPGTVISGTIDLVFAVDDARKEWVVFDWKSHVPPEGDRLRERYREQLKKYAEALVKTVDGAQVTQMEIVGPYPELGETPPLDVGLEDISGALRAPLLDLVSRGAPWPKVWMEVELSADRAPEADLVWEEQRIAIARDWPDEDVEALRARGWTVALELDETIARALGLAPVATEDE